MTQQNTGTTSHRPKCVEGAQDPEEKYKMYADYREAVSKIPSHRMLAIRRGAKEEILNFEIELEPATALAYLKNKVVRERGDWVPHLEQAVEVQALLRG